MEMILSIGEAELTAASPANTANFIVNGALWDGSTAACFQDLSHEDLRHVERLKDLRHRAVGELKS